jgi:hypothetical protein
MCSKTASYNSSSLTLPTIKCECGHEILLLPDLIAMGKAIERHSFEHKVKDCLSQAELDAFEENLIAQAFTLISELETISKMFHEKTTPSHEKKERAKR